MAANEIRASRGLRRLDLDFFCLLSRAALADSLTLGYKYVAPYGAFS